MSNFGIPKIRLESLVRKETQRVEKAKEAISWERFNSGLGIDELSPSSFTLEVRQMALMSLRSTLREVDPFFSGLSDGEVRDMNDALPPTFFKRVD